MAGRKGPVVEKAPPGRPTKYSPELGDLICTEISEGKSLRLICEPHNMPDRRSVFRWLREHDEFCHQYAHAREAAADHFAEEIVEIADQATDKEDAPAIKVRVDARMWVASKLRPRVYGNIAAIQHSGPDGGPIRTAATIAHTDLAKLSDDELAKFYAEKVESP